MPAPEVRDHGAVCGARAESRGGGAGDQDAEINDAGHAVNAVYLFICSTEKAEHFRQLGWLAARFN